MDDKKKQTKSERSAPTVLPGDTLDLAGLAGKLRDPKDPFSRYLHGRLQPDTRKMLDAFDGSKSASSRLTEALAQEFSQVAAGSAIFEPQRFAQIELSAEARALLETNPEGKKLIRLNLMLIEEAYPYELLRNVSKVPKVNVERVQTGLRMERRMLKVLKALAEYRDMTLGALVEEIVLHAFEGLSTYDTPERLERVATLKRVYGMDYDIHASYRFVEKPTAV